MSPACGMTFQAVHAAIKLFMPRGCYRPSSLPASRYLLLLLHAALTVLYMGWQPSSSQPVCTSGRAVRASTLSASAAAAAAAIHTFHSICGDLR